MDGAEFGISGSNEASGSAFVGESGSDGTARIHDFQSEPANTECFEATGNMRQMRDGRIGRYDNVDGGKTASMEMGEKDKDEIGVPANPSDVVGSSCQTCEGVEDHERSCKATTEVEDQRDFSSVKRDRTVEAARDLAKAGKGSGTRCASNPGRDHAKRGRARGTASRSINTKSATSTSGKGTASSIGRGTGRGRGSTLGKGATFSSRRGTTVSLGTDRGSSSRRGTTTMGGSSRSGPYKDSNSGSVGESETDDTSSIDRFRPEMGDAECPEAMGNRRQTRDGKIGHDGSVEGGKTACMVDRKKDEDEIGESANQNNAVRSSCLRCQGVEHYERSCKATTEVEDQRDLSAVERDRTLEADRVHAKRGRGRGTRCASEPGRNPAQRGRARGIASSLRNSKALSSGRDATSTSGEGVASNSGRGIVSSPQSSTALSSGRGTTKMGAILRSGTDKGSSSAKAVPRASRSRQEQQGKHEQALKQEEDLR